MTEDRSKPNTIILVRRTESCVPTRPSKPAGPKQVLSSAMDFLLDELRFSARCSLGRTEAPVLPERVFMDAVCILQLARHLSVDFIRDPLGKA